MLLNFTELEDRKQMGDLLFALHWGIYGGFFAALALYYPSGSARDSTAHWLIRWPWIISWHCMAVSYLAGLFLKYCFVKLFVMITYDKKLSRSVLETIERRRKLAKQLDDYNILNMCGGVAILFILGAALAVAGIITLVLGRFGAALHGVWSPVKYIILWPLRFSEWVLRGVGSRLKSVIRLADRVGRATGRNAVKSGPLLLAFAKLYGRTLAKFSRSLVVFAVDLVKLLLLTVVVAAFGVAFVLLYHGVRGTPIRDPSTGDSDPAHATRESRKDATSQRQSTTPPPAYESLDGDMPAGNPGKKNRPRRKKHKEGVDAS